jgi:5-hydroxyisourate hydrolase
VTVLSSHVLDSISGKSAIGFRVQLFRIGVNGQKEQVFDVMSDHEGRIAEQLILENEEQEFELVFNTRDYIEREHGEQIANQPLSAAVIRLHLSKREQRYHVPLVLSPHSYTVWWSE